MTRGSLYGDFTSVRITGERTVYSAKKFDLAIHSLIMPNGESLQREYLRHPGSVVLLPVLPADRVVLIQNYRHAVDKVLLELPAGTLDRGEDVAVAAARELAEETGYRAGKLTKMLEFYPAPGLVSELMVLFLADQLTPGQPSRESDEEMETLIVPLARALEMTTDGRIVDAKTMVGLWNFARQRAVAG